MCGFTLVVYKNKKKTLIKQDVLNHRGPDHTKYIFYKGINLRHWRLSIVDLSNKSNQPIQNKSFLFAYNGEIYDFKSISKLLLNKKNNSDTLTIFSLLNKFKNLKILKKFAGFYSYVYLDKKKNEIIFSRDLIGKKFLYYYKDSEKLIISSEEKGILSFIEPKIDKISLLEYFCFKNLYNGKTFFKNIKSIPPGSITKFNLNKWKIKHQQSWPQYYKKAIFQKKKYDINLNKLLTKSIFHRNLCDVKTQLALSSGLDSNLLLEKILKNKSIHNFYRAIGVGFGKNVYNENNLTKKINKKNKFKFHQIYYDSKYFFRDLKKCIFYNDGPLEHPNYIGMNILCKEASKKGKVLITGEGADDLFFGYDHYKLKKIKNSFAFRLFINQKKLKKEIFKNNNSLLSSIYKNINFDYYRKLALSSKAKSRDLEFKTHLQSLLKRNDKIGMKNSIEIRCPFLDIEILKKLGTRSDFIKKDLYKKIFFNKEVLNFNQKKIGFYIPINSFLKKKNSLQAKKYFDIGSVYFKKHFNIEINKKLLHDSSILWLMVNIGIFVDKFYAK